MWCFLQWILQCQHSSMVTYRTGKGVNNYCDCKSWQSNHAAPTTRLICETIEPFTSDRLYPPRSSSHFSCNKIKRTADTHRYRYMKFMKIAGNPKLLFRSAISNEQNMRTRIVDLLTNVLLFFGTR